MSQKNKRRKRATVEDLYRSCKQGGYCPPDVVPKVEGTTVADRILQIGGSAVYFGGLGIGTGKGTGGGGGYVPLGEGGGVRVGGPGIRPSIPVDPVVPLPRDLIPIETVRPEDPSVITLSEGTPGGDISNVDVIAEVHPFQPDTATLPPTVTDGDSTAILEVFPDPVPPMRGGSRITRTHYHNPTFQVSVHSTATSGETSAADEILVTLGSSDTVIGSSTGEDIPLRLFPGSSRSTLESEFLETDFGGRTSTPVPTPERPVVRPRRPGLLSRFFQQARVYEPVFSTRPQELVTFDNPAFEPDVTMTFQQDVDEIARAAPRVEFQDIVELGRPIFSETAEGHVRVSRLGRRGTIRTRAGTVIGGRVHFYQDLSSIETDDIPLLTYAEQTGGGVVVGGSAETGIDAELGGVEEVYPEDALLDEYEPVGEHTQLVIGERRSTRVLTIPNADIFSPETLHKTPAGVVVDWDKGGSRAVVPAEGVTPAPPFPDIIIHDVGSSVDYILHPGLLPRRRRKRKRSY
ncbi:putative late L2 protein [Eptesicus serotinus papillomavirus 2]|uniref:Minor capsid protein L2 n=1 Tax=Eptesicus serotinus papillomavirus 2 TaxID=1464072 RepID=W8EFZ8_9PAPI|nr:putative late L2 protein [Eptesicus serotinus papillomavirus 2]AHJ81394.1 putative late L2 protein [Eptesicus serotinus papillomavirus 2]